jgi:hypothetical protein
MTQTELTEEQLERIRDFVTALRSGEYEQGTGILSGVQDGRLKHCCQGVAFERYGEALGYHATRTEREVLRGRDPLALSGYGSALTAPRRFWQDMGLTSPSGQFTLDVAARDGQVYGYADLNDSGFTFEQIADLIEWQFLSNTEVTM